MKLTLCLTLAAVVALGGVSRAQSTEKKAASPGSNESSEKEKLIGSERGV